MFANLERRRIGSNGRPSLKTAAVAVLMLATVLAGPDGSRAETTLATATISGECGEGLTWSFSTGTGRLMVFGTGPMRDFSPADARWGGNDVKSVTISEGVTSVGDHAFSGCTFYNADGRTRLGDSEIAGYVFEGADSILTKTHPHEYTYTFVDENGTKISKVSFDANNMAYQKMPAVLEKEGYIARWDVGAFSLENREVAPIYILT